MKTTRWRSTTKWLGLRPYDLALAEQMNIWQSLQLETSGGKGTLLGCEHPATITLGRRATSDEILSYSSDIPVFKIDRGGQATLHAPGQLVIYPIFSLRDTEMGVRDFVRLLLGTTTTILAELGIETENREDTGLYTKNGKICFVGLRVEKSVTRHGLSLNVSNDLDLFSAIRSCGVSAQRMDAVALHGVQASTESLFLNWARHFEERLQTHDLKLRPTF